MLKIEKQSPNTKSVVREESNRLSISIVRPFLLCPALCASEAHTGTRSPDGKVCERDGLMIARGSLLASLLL